MYYLRDLAEEDITDYFYEEDLNRVRKHLSSYIFVKCWMKKASVKGRNISWRGYPTKFNSWIKASDLQDSQ